MNEDNQHERSPEEQVPEADEPILNLTEAVNDPEEDETSSDAEEIDPLAATWNLKKVLTMISMKMKMIS